MLVKESKKNGQTGITNYMIINVWMPGNLYGLVYGVKLGGSSQQHC